MAKKETLQVASVLAFEKKLVSSDGYLYGTTWDKRHQKSEATPLKLVEKSVRGTISNRMKQADLEDPLKLNKKMESPNLQRVDACALGEHQDTLKLNFTLKVLGGIDTPSACNNELFAQSYAKAANDYVAQYGFKELARRYAMNIANGRFLWRNRVGAEQVEVIVKADQDTWTFNAFDFSLRNFETQNADVQALADKIAAALSRTLPYLLLEITTYARVGAAQEVYPSEELVLDKSNAKEKKSKILYEVNDVAAMHSQKIGNALRTIDTWYPDYASANIGPIAVEVYGAVTNLGKAYRTDKKDHFYGLFDRFAVGEPLASVEDMHYVMAVLVRGGVFGQSSKE
jgi:CRISPR-associated protein Csy3